MKSLIIQYLQLHPSDRDINIGAMLRLKIDRNQIAYRAALRHPDTAAPQIEQFLTQYLRDLDKKQAQESARITAREEAIKAITQIQAPKTDAAVSDTEKFKAGLRTDHNSLPPEIQALYEEAMQTRRRMANTHLEIRHLLLTDRKCATDDIKILTKLLIADDKKAHTLFNKYDKYAKQ